MIKKLYRWLQKRFGRNNHNNSYIEFIIQNNGSIDFNCKWNLGEEERFAELLYSLNTGALLISLVESIKKVAETNQQTDSYGKMVQTLYNLYNIEMEQILAEEENDMNAPIVCPSEVFGNNKNNTNTEEQG